MSLGTLTAAELTIVAARGQGHTPTISTRTTPECTMKQGSRESPKRTRGKNMPVTSIMQAQMPTRVPKPEVMMIGEVITPSHRSDSHRNIRQMRHQRLVHSWKRHGQSQKLLTCQEVRQIKKRFRKICWLSSKSTMTIILMNWKLTKLKLNLNQRKFRKLKNQLHFQHKPKTLLHKTQSSWPRRPRRAPTTTAEQLKMTMAMMITKRSFKVNKNLLKPKRKNKVKKPKKTTKLTQRANTAHLTVLIKKAKIAPIKGKWNNWKSLRTSFWGESRSVQRMEVLKWVLISKLNTWKIARKKKCKLFKRRKRRELRNGRSVRRGHVPCGKGGNKKLLLLLSKLQPERKQRPRRCYPNLKRKMTSVHQKNLKRKKPNPKP